MYPAYSYNYIFVKHLLCPFFAESLMYKYNLFFLFHFNHFEKKHSHIPPPEAEAELSKNVNDVNLHVANRK